MEKEQEWPSIETENCPALKQYKGLHWCVASGTGETMKYNPESPV